MSIKGEVTDTTHALTDAIETLSLAFPRKMMREILTEQARLFGRDVTRFTPPKTKGQGTRRVAKDVGKAIRLIRPADWTSPRIVKVIRAKDTNAFLQMARHMGGAGTASPGVSALRNLRIALRTGKQMAEAHQQLRDRRGRVRRKARTPFFTFEVSAYRSYVKAVKDRVGMAKGGWAAGWLSLGGKPPAWVARHKNMGLADDGRKGRGKGAFFLFINRSPWASGGEAERIRDNAMKARIKKIEAQAEFIIGKEMKKLEGQLKRAAARRG